MAGIELLAVAIKYGVQILLARAAGAYEFGLYTYSLTWLTTLAIPAGLGLSAMVIRYVPEYTSFGRWGHLRSLLRFTTKWTLIGSLCALALALPTVLTLADGSTKSTTLAALCVMPLLCLVTLQGEVLRGGERVITSRVLPNLVQPAVLATTVCTIFFALGAISAMQAIFAYAIALAVTGALQRVFLRRALAEVRRHTMVRGQARQWGRLSAQLLGIKLGQLVLNNSDILAVGVYLGPLSAGIYAAAVKTAAMAGVVTQAVNLSVPPDVARLHARGDGRELEGRVRTAAKFAFVPTGLASAVLILAAPQILSVFGEEFAHGAAALQILALGRLITAWTGPVGSILNVTGHQVVSVYTYTAAAGLQLTLLVVLLPVQGILGAAIASTAATATWNVVLTYFVITRLKVRVWPLPAKVSGA